MNQEVPPIPTLEMKMQRGGSGCLATTSSTVLAAVAMMYTPLEGCGFPTQLTTTSAPSIRVAMSSGLVASPATAVTLGWLTPLGMMGSSLAGLRARALSEWPASSARRA